ncbi:hypothetical protein ACFYZE_11510 [Streptomyces sp. NPDC001796]|uniref:hypothetical protein n=1 Tax=Streptomyces sp. NPDC001796 TaxID=3364609 RepID=UPI0036798807
MGWWLSEGADKPRLVAVFDGAHPYAADVIASGGATPGRASARYKGGLTGHGTGLGKPALGHASTEPVVGLPDCAEELAHSVWQAGQRSE